MYKSLENNINGLHAIIIPCWSNVRAIDIPFWVSDMFRQDFRIGNPRQWPAISNSKGDLIQSREIRKIQSPDWMIMVVRCPPICSIHHTVRDSHSEGNKTITLVDTRGQQSDTRWSAALIRCLLSLGPFKYLHWNHRNDNSKAVSFVEINIGVRFWQWDARFEMVYIKSPILRISSK